MIKKAYIIVLVGLFCLSFMIGTADAQKKIWGPYLWMFAPTVANQGGQASTDIDSLKVASDGKVTEEKVAKNSVKENDEVGDLKWTFGTLQNDGDINALLLSLGMTRVNDLNDVTSYALVNLKTKKAQSDVAMGVSSDDSIKVWLNGEVVHRNAVNRGRGGANTFQDSFKIDLKKGNNILMVKVSERGGGWGMYVGVDGDYTIEDPSDALPVEPHKKLTTQWANLKSER